MNLNDIIFSNFDRKLVNRVKKIKLLLNKLNKAINISSKKFFYFVNGIFFMKYLFYGILIMRIFYCITLSSPEIQTQRLIGNKHFDI